MNRLYSYFIINLLLLFSFNLKAQKHSYEQKLVASDRNKGDMFGWSCATWGNYLFSGVPQKNKKVNNKIIKCNGAVFVYKKLKDNIWKELQILGPEDNAYYDWFGCSIAAYNDFCIIGANGDDDDKDTSGFHREGAAYIYKRNGDEWKLKQKLILSNRSGNDNFGKHVAITSNYIAVSAFGRPVANSIGAIYLYKKTNKEEWVLANEIIVPYYDGSGIISSIALTDKDLVIGIEEKSQGVLHYSIDNYGNCQLVETIKCPNMEFISSGNSVSIFEGYLAIGVEGGYGPYDGQKIPDIDSVYVYARMKEDGDFQLVHVPNDRKIMDSLNISRKRFDAQAQPVESAEKRELRKAGAGSVYIYKKENGHWKFLQELTASDRAADAHFGMCISLYDKHLVVGAFGDKLKDHSAEKNFYAGAAYVFELQKDGNWKEIEKLTASPRSVWDKYGFSVSCYENRCVVGSRFEKEDANENNTIKEAGAVYLYEY